MSKEKIEEILDECKECPINDICAGPWKKWFDGDIRLSVSEDKGK